MIIFLSIFVYFAYLWVKRTYKTHFDFMKNSKYYKGSLTLDVMKTQYDECYEKLLKPIFSQGYESVWLANNLMLVMHDPEDIKTILNSEKSFEKPFFYEFYFKNGLLTIGGEKYKTHRKALNPMFLPSNLRSLIPTIDDRSREFIEEYAEDIEQHNKDIKILSSMFSYNTILQTIVGVPGLDKETLHVFADKSEEFMTRASTRIFKPWMYPDFIFRRTNEYKIKQRFLEDTMEISESHWKNTDAKDNEGATFFSCMRNLMKEMPREEYCETIALFLGASFETTAGAIVNILVLLGMNPEKQQKLYEEISSIITADSHDITEEMLNEMKYLDLVLKETLRLIPNAIVMARKATEEIQLKRFIVPANTFIIFPILEIHRDKAIWGDDALEFRPERFTDESFKNIHPYAYIPFSNGPRMCPGYKYAMITLKIFISRFVMKYRISTNMKYEDLKFILGLTLKFQQPPLLNIEKRF